MTEAEVITLINSQLPTNGNNEITAAVLRPVLISATQQINGVVGDPTQLPPGKTVIEAINDIYPEGVIVHTGANDPNDTPPANFNIGDFYQQVVIGSTVGFWQFMGEQWIDLLAQSKLRTDTGDNNRPEWYNGTEWKGLAYKDEIEVTTFTGNELPLTNPLGRKQTATPNTSATFTIAANPVLGGNVKVLINRATEPTLPATTLGISGTSGTANINIGGDDYLVTFDTDLTTTASNFVTDHAAAILADHDLTVTSSVQILSFLGGKRVNRITNATGNLTGLIVNDIRKRLGSNFQADTDMYLVVEQEDGFIEYQFQEIVL